MPDFFGDPKTVTVFVLSISVLFRWVLERRKRFRHPHPPGPKGYPIIGNLFDIGTGEKPWETYSNFARQYGDIVFFEALGTRILVLSSLRRTSDLLESRSSKYSGRPQLPMVSEHMGYGDYFSIMDYSPAWRRHRKEFHQHFNPTVVSRYHTLLFKESTRLIQDLASSPDKFSNHLDRFFNQVIVKSVYRFDILDQGDPVVTQGKEVLDGLLAAAVPGAFLVDLIPALKYVPRWMPGTGWRKFADHYAAASAQARREPFERALNECKEGIAEVSVASRMIENLPASDDARRKEEENIAQNTVAVAYIGGSDTSLAAARTFILLMATYPEVQRKAQAEIDSVVGYGQIPTFKDRPKLVYLNALLREVFRWHREVPLGVPHGTTEDGIYDGYFIPKGTIVISNIWHILWDPVLYPNPSEFNPERHIKDGQINKDVLDPYVAAFGFGRRICPGRHMSLDTIYVMVSSLLTLFDISPPEDEAGNSTLNASFNTSGLIITPNPFDCVITPRSARHAEIIRGL